MVRKWRYLHSNEQSNITEVGRESPVFVGFFDEKTLIEKMTGLCSFKLLIAELLLISLSFLCFGTENRNFLYGGVVQNVLPIIVLMGLDKKVNYFSEQSSTFSESHGPWQWIRNRKQAVNKQ